MLGLDLVLIFMFILLLLLDFELISFSPQSSRHFTSIVNG